MQGRNSERGIYFAFVLNSTRFVLVDPLLFSMMFLIIFSCIGDIFAGGGICCGFPGGCCPAGGFWIPSRSKSADMRRLIERLGTTLLGKAGMLGRTNAPDIPMHMHSTAASTARAPPAETRAAACSGGRKCQCMHVANSRQSPRKSSQAEDRSRLSRPFHPGIIKCPRYTVIA